MSHQLDGTFGLRVDLVHLFTRLGAVLFNQLTLIGNDLSRSKKA
jgi:hypothetical protein